MPTFILDGLLGGDRAPRAKRLLVTMWVLEAEHALPTPRDLPARARRVWDVAIRELNRPARVTVLSALLQLKELGLVLGVEQTEGGYRVRVSEEAAA